MSERDERAGLSARENVAAYLADLDAFYAGEHIEDTLDAADGGWGSAPLRLSDLRGLVARAEAAEARVADAWDEGRDAGLADYDDRMPDHTPNPYRAALTHSHDQTAPTEGERDE